MNIPQDLHLLIDADSAFYKAGCANEDRFYNIVLDGQLIDSVKYKKDAKEIATPLGAEIIKAKTAGDVRHSLSNIRSIMDNKILVLPHKSYEVFIGGKGNFRYDYFPEYKGERDPLDKPTHLEQMKKHLEGRYNAQRINGEEVDDCVSYKQAQAATNTTCICTIDKDLDNTAGWHWNYGKQRLYYVTEEQARLNFARQLLSGDDTDGIPGLKGVATKTAIALLPEYRPDWLEFVKSIYLERGYTIDYLTIQGIMLHMRRKPNEIWSLDYIYEEV